MSTTVTVIIPTFNNSVNFYQSISSVINQTYKVTKIVVIDDNSDDFNNLKKIIDKCKLTEFNNIELIRNNKNFGPGYSRNLAWNHSTTDLIAFNDDDDIWYKTKLEEQINIFKKIKNADMVICKKKNNSFNKTIDTLKIFKINFSSLIFKNSIPTSCVLISSKIEQRFLEDYFAEDYFLWLSMLIEKKNCYMFDKTLCEESNAIKNNKLTSNLDKMYLNVQKILNMFLRRNLFLNMLILLAKVNYKFKYIIKKNYFNK